MVFLPEATLKMMPTQKAMPAPMAPNIRFSAPSFQGLPAKQTHESTSHARQQILPKKATSEAQEQHIRLRSAVCLPQVVRDL